MNWLRQIQSPAGTRLTVNRQYADQFGGLLDDLEMAGYPAKPGQTGGYNHRNIAGTNQLSNHADGSAVDINWNENARGTAGAINRDLARALAAKHGMTWGGDWSNPDPMHFEINKAGEPRLPALQLLNADGSNSPQAAAGGGSSAQPAAQPQPAAAAPTARPAMAEQQREPTFLEELAGRTQNPLFQGGLGMFLAASQGGDLNQGLSAGIDRAGSMQNQQMQAMEMRRQQVSRQAVQSLLKDPQRLAGLPPGLVDIVRATGDPAPLLHMMSRHPEMELEKQKLALGVDSLREQTAQRQQLFPLQRADLEAATDLKRAHGEYYRGRAAVSNSIVTPPDIGVRRDGTVYEIGRQRGATTDGAPGSVPVGDDQDGGYRAESDVRGDATSVPPSRTTESEHGPTGVVTTDVPGVVTRRKSGASDAFATQRRDSQRAMDSLPDEDRQRYLERIRDRQVRETVFGKPPAGHDWDASGKPIRISQPPETASDRQSKVIAKQGMYNLDLAEKALVGKGGNEPTVGTFGQIVGDSWKLPAALGGVQLGQWGEGAIAFRQAKRAIMDLNFALSGKSVSNAEREAFLELYMPKSTDSREAARDKLQSARVFFQAVLAARNNGGSDDDIASLYRGHIHARQGGSQAAPAGSPPQPASPGVQKYGNKYQGLE